MIIQYTIVLQSSHLSAEKIFLSTFSSIQIGFFDWIVILIHTNIKSITTAPNGGSGTSTNRP